MNLRNLSQEELECIEKYSGLLFSPSEISDILEVDRQIFIQAYKDNEQNIQSKYKKGYLFAQVQLRDKLFTLAYDGSNTAITEFLKILAETNKNIAKL